MTVGVSKWRGTKVCACTDRFLLVVVRYVSLEVSGNRLRFDQTRGGHRCSIMERRCQQMHK